MIGKPFLACAALLLASCTAEPGEEGAAASAEAQDTAASATATASAQGSAKAQPENFSDNATRDNAERSFTYIWPAAVSEIPALASQLREQRREYLAEQKTEWDSAMAEMPADCVSCRMRSYSKEWQVVADIPQFLSLSAATDIYLGGAHGMQGFDALVWDREAGAPLEPIDVFERAEDFNVMLGEPFCDALNEAREERRGAPVEPTGEWPNDCPSLDEVVLILGSGNGQTFDRLGFLVPPYVAGAYAEGTYDITLPVTPAVVGIVKPQYRAAFSARN